MLSLSTTLVWFVSREASLTCFFSLPSQIPFEEFGLEETGMLEGKIISGVRPSLPSDTPHVWAELISTCWKPLPADRMPRSLHVALPYFREYKCTLSPELLA
jgi:hypothetical protein